MIPVNILSEYSARGFLIVHPTKMDRTATPGLEIVPSTSPQVAPQPDENKYYVESERWNHPDLDQSNHQFQVKRKGLVKAIGALVMIVVLLLAAVLGVGLGVGLSAQHKQRSSK